MQIKSSKKTIRISSICLFLVFLSLNASANPVSKPVNRSYGNTLNIGLGIGYYGYVGHNTPVVHANYEFDVAKNFTLAPFISMYTYKKYYYWGGPNHPYQDYSYVQTVIPMGVKGSYYFDEILKANSKWDFYLAGSLGFALRRTKWQNTYYGDTKVINEGSNLYLDAHIGSEYHINSKAGLFLDLSTGVSTFGVAVHF